MAATNTFSFRLPIVALVLCLTAGLLIFAIGNWQTRLLAEAESQRLGRALTAQLTETIRQPILHDDLVSLQVNVEQLVQRAEVAGAVIYNPQQRQLAQSGTGSDSPNNNLTSYREALVIEGKTVAYASVNIDTTSLLARYRTPLNWALAIWGIFTFVLTAIGYLAGSHLSRRLGNLYKRLPGEESLAASRDELELLTQRLQPLLTQNAEESKSEAPPAMQIATMALHCKNLQQLEVQLSKDKLQRLLNKIDDDLAQIAALYDGQRQSGRDQTLFLEFSGDLENGDHPLRALFCAHILLQLTEDYARSLGIAMELSAAVKLSIAESGSSLLGDFEREKRETEVARLARLGGRSETLVDSSTCLHHTLDGIITTVEISESSDVHKIDGFSASHNALLEKQLTYLSTHPDRA